MNQKRHAMKGGKSQLRTEAEAKLARATQTGASARPAEELLHELQVHQIELEMQNEELRRAYRALEDSRDRFLDLYEFAPVGYLTLTGQGLISEVNLAGARLLGEERKKVLQRRFARFVTSENIERYDRLFASMMQHDEQQACELALRRGDGSVFHAQLDCLRVAAGDKPPVVRIALTSITERKQAEAALQESEARKSAIVQTSLDCVVTIDHEGKILEFNPAAERVFGHQRAEVLGRELAQVIIPPSLREAHRQGLKRYLATGEAQVLGKRIELTALRSDGSEFPVEVAITRMGTEEPPMFTGFVRDITQRKAAEADIKHLAFYDSLTQLPNRRLLLDRLQQALAARTRSRRQGAILFIDLDDFKSLNDNQGHDIGDMLLQEVARRLLASVREVDTVARLGGDEFVVVLEELSGNPRQAAIQAEIVGEKILVALAQPYILAGHEHHSTVGIGITLFSDQRETVDDLLKRADLAVYQAKAAGRNTLRFFDQEMQAAVSARTSLEGDLRRGVREGQLVIYYQPQVDGEGRLTGAEALVRWQHPRRGLIDPAEFIPLAEETGLIHPLGHLVLESVCAQLRDWSARPDTAHLSLAMNISAREFRHPEFLERVLVVIDRAGVDPHKLMFEFTESLLLDDLQGTVAKMAALKARGGGFSLDDFGTGYSSLAYLKHLPLDQLKIDQSFVRGILTDSNDAAIARTIMALGESLGLAVIAEGVETVEQRDFLAGQGCHAFQGYLFGRPGPVEALPVTA
jgi:diguanylate cyclase (GGDEF)-like protein/PAS domain S-box-containing protein